MRPACLVGRRTCWIRVVTDGIRCASTRHRSRARCAASRTDWRFIMLPLNENTLRASFVNASRKEISDMTLPAHLDTIDWDRLDYLGWRDPRSSKRAYIVVPTPDGATQLDFVGILLRQSEAKPRTRAQCSWCQDVQLPNDVQFYGARRAGEAGRKGDTVGTLICSEFECSVNVRKSPPMAYIGFDVDAARQDRILGLQARAAGFAGAVLHGT